MMKMMMIVITATLTPKLKTISLSTYLRCGHKLLNK